MFNTPTSLSRYLPGLFPVAALTLISLLSIRIPTLNAMGIGPLTIAIALGIVLGNLTPALARESCQPGLRLSQSRLLRVGVALYGLNLSVQQVMQVGTRGIVIDLVMVASTLAIGLLLGTRVFKLDKETALLTAAGSAICGAAAIVATAPLLKMPQEKSTDTTAAAVSTVVVFGSLAMLLYPALYSLLNIPQASFGLYVGSTVHEVAQVVAIGNVIGIETAHAAVIVKMIRVLLLIPFLLGLSMVFRSSREKRISIPWFALAFLMLALINSFSLLPAALADALRNLGLVLLTAAMAALGIDTRIARFRQVGLRALGLGICLFAHLIFIGGLVNYLCAA